MMRRVPVILGLLALLLAAAPAWAQDGKSEKPAASADTGAERVESGDDVPSPTREEIIRRNKEIWDRMTPEQRKRALEQLKKFQKMSAAERKRLLTEAKRLIGQLDRETREEIAKKNRRREWQRAYKEMRSLLDLVFKRLPAGLKESIGKLDKREKHGLERVILSRLFETQAEIARKSLDEPTRTRLAKAARNDRHRYMRLLFDRYTKTILEKMPDAEKARIAALPKAERKKSRHVYAKKVIGRRIVDLVTRTVVPDLEKLMTLPADERRKKISSLSRGHRAARRGPRGFPSPGRISKEDRKKLEAMSEEDRKAFFAKRSREFHERMRRSLAAKGLTTAELDALDKIPIHRRWRTLQRSHPELFERPTAEERTRLAKATPEQKLAFYERKRKRHANRLGRQLTSHGVAEEDLARLMAMPPLLRWQELEKTHPEWFKTQIREPGKSGRHGGPPRGPRHDRKKPAHDGDEKGD